MKASLRIDWNFKNKWGNRSVVWKNNKIKKRKAIFENLLIEAIETSVKLKVTPEDVFLGSDPRPIWISRAINPPPPHLPCLLSWGCGWFFSGITHYLKKRKRQTKVAKIYYFVSGIHFHLIDMQKWTECPRIFKCEIVHKEENIYILFQFWSNSEC